MLVKMRVSVGETVHKGKILNYIYTKRDKASQVLMCLWSKYIKTILETAYFTSKQNRETDVKI